MKTLVAIFTEAFKSFFNNSEPYLEARKLTVDDFHMEVIEESKENLMKSIGMGYGAYAGKFVKLTLKKNVIKMLEEMNYFDNFQKLKFSEFSKTEQENWSTGCEGVTLTVKLKTPKGGTIRNKTKVNDKVDKAIVKTRDLFEQKKDECIEKILERFNSNIERLVRENNTKFKEGVMDVLTNRERLNDLLELNADNDGVAKIKMAHDITLAQFDGEIDVYKKAIAKLEKAKTERYVETAQALFGDDIEKLPPAIKDEVETQFNEDKAFTQLGRKGMFFK